MKLVFIERIKRFWFRVLIFSLACTMSFVTPVATFALTNNELDTFAQNNILFYDPGECITDCRVECVASNGSDVTIIGDSLLADETTKSKLKSKLSGLQDASYDAVIGRHWDQGVDVAKNMSLKNILVFELGTNNDPGITAEQINALLSVVGTDRTIVLITPYTAGSESLKSAFETTSLQFKEIAKTNSQIIIADWAEKAKNAGLQLNDGESRVHPTDDGERNLFVETVAQSITSSCNSGDAMVSGSTAEEKVWSGFRSLGFTAAQTAGIMGNIAHEGLMNPAQWQVGKEEDWGKTLAEMYAKGSSNSTGMGLVAFTWYKYFDLLNKYYSQNAPDLLSILEDPYTYSVAEDGSHYCDGNCFLKKVDDNTANRVYSTQITIINDVVRGKYKDEYGFDYSGYLAIDDVEQAAEWWLTNYEKPADPAASRGVRIADAKKFYEQFKDSTSFSGGGSTGGYSGSNCGNVKAATAFRKYNFTDGQLKGILAIAKAENGGSLSAIQTELSIMANLFEYYGPKKGEPADEGGFLHYIQRAPGSEGGWFATYDKYDESLAASNEEFEAAKSILNNGNRTLPPQILEHDYIGDIKSVSNDGVSFDKNDRSKYVKGKTVIVALGDPYVFYTWADPSNSSGDPFGYFENNPPDASFSAETTQAANAAVTSVDITWQDGWITGGMEGYIKGTPEAAGMAVGDSSPTVDYATNRPIDGQMGPNKITLHNTQGYNSVGQYGLDIYRSNPYPPHFTIDLKEKKVYQHFTVDRPSSALASVDTSGGVQIEIIGFSTEEFKNDSWYLFSSENFGDDAWAYLAKLLVGISSYTGIPLTSTVNWTDREGSRMTSVEEFKNYTGVLGHQHAPENDHNDPGDVWSLVSKHFSTLGTDIDTTCGEVPVAADFEWYNQCDDKWGNTPYGACGDTCSSGCGVVSFTMMAQALTKVKLDPAEVTKNAGGRGLHVCGEGSSHALPETLADDYGVSVEVLGSASVDELNAKLKSGAMIWTCGKGANPFTGGGHCIGIRGITADGKWLLADSNGEKGRKNSTEIEWDPNDVYPRMNNYRVITKK